MLKLIKNKRHLMIVLVATLLTLAGSDPGKRYLNIEELKHSGDFLEALKETQRQLKRNPGEPLLISYQLDLWLSLGNQNYEKLKYLTAYGYYKQALPYLDSHEWLRNRMKELEKMKPLRDNKSRQVSSGMRRRAGGNVVYVMDPGLMRTSGELRRTLNRLNEDLKAREDIEALESEIKGLRSRELVWMNRFMVSIAVNGGFFVLVLVMGLYLIRGYFSHIVTRKK